MATNLRAFDAETLEAALARVTQECGPGARIAGAEKVRTGGVAGFFARERFEVTVEIDDDPGREHEPARPEPPQPEVPPSPRSLLDLVEEASAQERTEVAPVPSTEHRTFQEVLRGIASDAGLLDPAPNAFIEHATALNEDGEVRLFASLGIPEELLQETVTPDSIDRRLLGVLEHIDPAPPVIARRGEVVAVIGDRASAIEAAGFLARQLGLCADDVVVAGPDERGFNSLVEPEAARDRVARWRCCGTPFVVAISAPPGASGTAWARDMRKALAPVATWAAVRAERKPEDIVRWVDAVGGADALAVSGCDDTATPAAVLAAGIPIGSVEGRRSSPAAWTAVLTERLTV